MNYDMEDTQNSAPGILPSNQAAKLGAPRRGNDAQSTTKRSVFCNAVTVVLLMLVDYKPS